MNILKENDLTPKDFAAGALTFKGISMIFVFAPEKKFSPDKGHYISKQF